MTFTALDAVGNALAQINGSGATDDTIITDAEGNAQVTLHAGTQSGTVQLLATITGPNGQVCSQSPTLHLVLANPQ